ncbi:phosphoglycerate dehydrogenase [Staphylococcus saccharolyticus]|uniref:D-3-phosphoglycerate dehydrogenase n=1 Tax=Staphylococcus saccharolyticus TaxID=33028 RepID=A0A380H1K2_9STAP|nr:phosphoglycerate dehydrogenase [Staphylococcus saccharolyticus]MBL7565912.1 phosphoglycerate dehydrogenase [Staphylococcus saccharolyticus]MBL7572351.1 phosphoglycerate dehydrogenase [Staphylococcus saccharolyticus]QQB98490.1 phosphoglycerate dehydrogenase [Staphylococcus saccharolyticus]QRJ67294.1 phosphoglycerate dehydrogenase [Staphylococcus saccharolyticus]RTX92720.1 hydroxyacid dehydrogenase [Staphylococcus saccharolyticus]
MKIVSLNRLKEIEDELRAKFPSETFKFYDKVESVSIGDRKTLDILIGYNGKIDKSFIEECENLKWIGWFATGVNNLPLDYINDKKIILTNGRGIQAKQLSEFIIAFILDDYKKMRTSYKNQVAKKYDRSLTGKRVKGEKLLFLGTGAIAQKTAYLAQAFGMKVIGISKFGKEKEHFDEIFSLDKLDKVIDDADIIVNSLPETKETIHLLQRGDFEKMKDDALFINIGRGTIVDEQVMVNVLKDKLIRHAYLDVFENEPLNSDNSLYELNNVTITAHITGNDKNINREATNIFERNLEYFLNNKDVIENKVDPNKGY